MSRAIKRIGERVGEPNMIVRSRCRAQDGENIVVVSKRLGRSNGSVTSDIYAHSLPGWQTQPADGFAAAMEDDGIRQARAS